MKNPKLVYFENASCLEIHENIVIYRNPEGTQEHLTFAQQQVLRVLANNINYPVTGRILCESYSIDEWATYSNDDCLKVVSKLKNTLPETIRMYMQSVRKTGYKLIGTIEKNHNSFLDNDEHSSHHDTNSDPENIFNGDFSNKIENGDTSFIHAKDFLERCVNNAKEIESIDMAFHSGWEWIKGGEKGHFLRSLDTKNIKIHVIVNHRDVIRKIAKTMSDPKMEEFYMGFNEGIKKWHNCVCMRNNLELRISDYPIFRKIYIVNYKDGTRDALMRDYAYDYSTEYDYGKILLSNNDVSLKIFRREFDFLWNHGLTYEQWSQKTPAYEEILTPDEYILLYLSHKKNDDLVPLSNEPFVISNLQISKNNHIKLEVNSAHGKLSHLTYTDPEYTYHGKAKITGNNIFITLLDETETVSLTIRKSIHNKKRFLGIMTAISEHAQPVAYKFACIHPSIINEIDIQKLSEVLMHNNNTWESNLMILEEQDIDLFYSNRIFTRDFSR